jgi:methylamine dehydrogenase light chain
MRDHSWFDRFFETTSRGLADRSGRRSFLAKLGAGVIGVAAMPLLPVARGTAEAAETEAKKWNDPKSCDYWAYCSIGGGLCACCGGTSEMCPPGSQPAQIGWVGTCRNPGDGKSYVISYHDCCGSSGCYDCACERNEGSQPRYRPQLTPFVNWCHGGNVPVPYTCTVAKVVSVAAG